jgi:hypothetical protein
MMQIHLTFRYADMKIYFFYLCIISLLIQKKSAKFIIKSLIKNRKHIKNIQNEKKNRYLAKQFKIIMIKNQCLYDIAGINRIYFIHIYMEIKKTLNFNPTF